MIGIAVLVVAAFILFRRHTSDRLQILKYPLEGKGYGNLGNAYLLLGDYQKAIEYQEKKLKLQKKSVIGPEKE